MPSASGYNTVNAILSGVLWAGFALCLIGVCISATRLALVRQDPPGRQAYPLLLALGACVVVGSAATLVGALA